MIGYDLDGTLADTNFGLTDRIGLTNVFEQAPVLRKPDRPFVVITARPHGTQSQRSATTKWLRDNQPNYKAIYYVSGSEAEIIKRKADVINRLNLTDFYDNNPDIVAELRKLCRATIHQL